MNKLRNDYIRQELGVESILKIIEKGQLRWFGHMKRMEENRYPRKYYEFRPQGKRRRGRLRMRWRDNIKTALKKRYEDLDDIEERHEFDDRQTWKSIVRQDN